MTDLLFDRFGLSCFAFVVLDTDLQVESNPNHRTGGQQYSDSSLYKVSEIFSVET